MRDMDVGALPVCDGRRLMGMITGRDIAVRQGALVDGTLDDISRASPPQRPATGKPPSTSRG